MQLLPKILLVACTAFPNALMAAPVLTATTAVSKDLCNLFFQPTAGKTACDQRGNKDPIYSRFAYNCFVDQFYRRLDFIDAIRTFFAADYIQHTPFLPDGRDATLASFHNSTLPPGFNPWIIVHQGWDNYIGYLHEKLNSPNVTALADYWRMDGPCLVEHWDSVQTLPPGGTYANPHPLF